MNKTEADNQKRQNHAFLVNQIAETNKEIEFFQKSIMEAKEKLQRLESLMQANELADLFDRDLSPSEAKVYDQLYNLTVGIGQESGQFRIKELMGLTGYGSDNTIKSAIQSLVLKGLLIVRSTGSNANGNIYQIANPQNNG
jgi:hypothetical protein